MNKKLTVDFLLKVLLVFTVFIIGTTVMSSMKVSKLERNIEAHKLAMSFANQAIHDLYDETLFLKDKGIKL
jgi:predicted cation transporter